MYAHIRNNPSLHRAIGAALVSLIVLGIWRLLHGPLPELAVVGPVPLPSWHIPFTNISLWSRWNDPVLVFMLVYSYRLFGDVQVICYELELSMIGSIIGMLSAILGLLVFPWELVSFIPTIPVIVLASFALLLGVLDGYDTSDFEPISLARFAATSFGAGVGIGVVLGMALGIAVGVITAVITASAVILAGAIGTAVHFFSKGKIAIPESIANWIATLRL